MNCKQLLQDHHLIIPYQVDLMKMMQYLFLITHLYRGKTYLFIVISRCSKHFTLNLGLSMGTHFKVQPECQLNLILLLEFSVKH